MDGQSGNQDCGQEHDVQHVQSGNHFHARELVTEEEVGHPYANHGEGLDYSVNDAQSVSRQQVIGEAVAGETLRHGQNEEEESDDPVQLAGLTESSGEEHAERVQSDRGHKEQCCPVVHLSHQQSSADVEGEIERGVVSHRHFDALEGKVRTLVGNMGHRGVVVESEEGTADENHDEGVEGNLTEHEGPVVRENFATEGFDSGRSARALVYVVGSPVGEPHAAADISLGCALYCCAHRSLSQKLGPTGSVNPLRATRYPSASMVIGSCGRGRAAGPKITSQ